MKIATHGFLIHSSNFCARFIHNKKYENLEISYELISSYYLKNEFVL